METQTSGGGVTSEQAREELEAMFGREWRMWPWPEASIPMPVELVFGDEVDWVAGHPLEEKAVVVPVDREFDLSRLKLHRIARMLSEIVGVVPDGFRGGGNVEVQPLPPSWASARRATWEISPQLVMVQRGLTGVYLEGVRGADVELEGSALLTGQQAWRWVQALIGARVWRTLVKQRLKQSAQEAREELGQLLKAAAG